MNAKCVFNLQENAIYLLNSHWVWLYKNIKISGNPALRSLKVLL